MVETVNYEREYASSLHVPDHREIVASWPVLAGRFRSGVRHETGQGYGAGVRQRMDVFYPAAPRADAAMVMFVHGGYWHSMTPDVFSHLAAGCVAQGLTVVMPMYTLCPQASIAEIIDEVRAACVAVWRRFRRPIVVTGHSAGGHLAACMLATDWPAIAADLPADLVTAGVGLSGLYDLAPMTQLALNQHLQLDAESAFAGSPLFWPAPAGKRFEAWVGGDETSEFHRQSRALAQAWSAQGGQVQYGAWPDSNHYTVIAPLADPDSELVARIVALAT